MPILLLLIFVGVPLVEIALFIYIGDIIGIAATIVIVVLTAFIGTALLRLQGLSVLRTAQEALDEGRIPVDSVIDGVFLLIAGAFLLTPGFLTDSIGFLLFVPFIRRGLARWIFQRLVESDKVSFTIFGSHSGNGPGGRQRPPGGGGPVIDGEFHPVDPDSDGKDENELSPPRHRPQGGSPWRR